MLYKRQKREQTAMMAGDLDGKVFDPMKPAIKKAITDEVESLCANMLDVCDNPTGDPKIELFCNHFKAEVPSELKRALRLNLARRMLPVLPIKVRAHSTPVVKRVPLEVFLKDYNVTALLKSVKKPYYVADVNTIAEHDLLCSMDPVKIDNSLVHFKPFHMFDTIKKSKHINKRREQAAKQLVDIGRKGGPNGGQPKVDQPKGGQPKNEVVHNISDDEQYENENACYDVVNNEELCDEIKHIYLKINEKRQKINHKVEDPEYYENKEAIEEVYLTGKQFTDNQDITDDVDADYVLDSPKGGTRHKREDNQTKSEKKLVAENIEMADVDADDLVDW